MKKRKQPKQPLAKCTVCKAEIYSKTSMKYHPCRGGELVPMPELAKENLN